MNQSLINRLETLERAKENVSLVNVKRNGYELFVDAKLDDDKRVYVPTGTGLAFHQSEKFVRLMMGPYGSGKSTACCTEIVLRTLEMPAWCNGMRRSKWAMIRNTSGELESTTLQTWLHWFRCLGSFTKRQKPVMTYTHTFKDEFGICEIELIFLALDREDDLRKIRSLELTGAYINEASETPAGLLSHIKGRVGRYPAPSLGLDYWTGVIADTNPPDTDHYLYKTFEEAKPENYEIFKQPAGLLSVKKEELDPNVESITTASGHYIANIHADNYKHLKPDYYLRMAEGQNEEFIKVFCKGEYGSVILGKRVYPEYNDDFHSKNDMQWVEGLPIDLFWDYGLTPACLITQFTARGQLRVMKEFCAQDMGIKQFAESVVLPYLRGALKGFTVRYSDGDPAGAKRAETDEKTCTDILSGLGIKTQGAATNNLTKRLESVRYFLNRLSDGQPSILISREGCPTLRKGFLGDYHYRRIATAGEARYHDEPNKNKASHPHDALQYCAMRFCSAELVNKKHTDTERIVQAVSNRPLRIMSNNLWQQT